MRVWCKSSVLLAEADVLRLHFQRAGRREKKRLGCGSPGNNWFAFKLVFTDSAKSIHTQTDMWCMKTHGHANAGLLEPHRVEAPQWTWCPESGKQMLCQFLWEGKYHEVKFRNAPKVLMSYAGNAIIRHYFTLMLKDHMNLFKWDILFVFFWCTFTVKSV